MEKDLTIARKYISGLNEDQKERLKAELRSKGYIINTEEDLITSWDSLSREPIGGFNIVFGLLAVFLIIITLISMC